MGGSNTEFYVMGRHVFLSFEIVGNI